MLVHVWRKMDPATLTCLRRLGGRSSCNSSISPVGSLSPSLSQFAGLAKPLILQKHPRYLVRTDISRFQGILVTKSSESKKIPWNMQLTTHPSTLVQAQRVPESVRIWPGPASAMVMHGHVWRRPGPGPSENPPPPPNVVTRSGGNTAPTQGHLPGELSRDRPNGNDGWGQRC